MKILAIGNTFSQDATRYLQQIAKAGGFQAEVVHLGVDGGSLERHRKNLKEAKKVYACERNGNETGNFVSVQEILQEGGWDVITLQQRSIDSGIYKTYHPHLEDLCEQLRILSPTSKLWLHETWAYDHFSPHSDFKLYQKDSDRMYAALRDCYRKVAGEIGASIIPVGDVIQTLRQRPTFDLLSGGMSLCRDTAHLSLDYGRYTAAAVWYETLFGGDIRENGYKLPMKNPNMAVLKEIREVVHSCCRR